MARPDWEELRRQLEISERKRVFLQKRLVLSSSEEDSTLWSYVDLLSLLLILFILFYSHAATHNVNAKDTTAEQSKRAAAQPSQDKKASAAAQPVIEHMPRPAQEAVGKKREKQDESLNQLRKQISHAVSEEDKDGLSVRWHRRRLIVTLGEKILFNAGNADLLVEVEPTLKRIADLIAPRIDYRVSVAGHTDDAPINNYQFPSNWELSAARAVNVAKFLIAGGVNPKRVSIEGYSAYRPLRANTNSRNRRSNRRVEITLFKDHESQIDSTLNAQSQFNQPVDPPGP